MPPYCKADHKACSTPCPTESASVHLRPLPTGCAGSRGGYRHSHTSRCPGIHQPAFYHLSSLRLTLHDHLGHPHPDCSLGLVPLHERERIGLEQRARGESQLYRQLRATGTSLLHDIDALCHAHTGPNVRHSTLCIGPSAKNKFDQVHGFS